MESFRSAPDRDRVAPEDFSEVFVSRSMSVPTIIWAPMIQHWLGYEAPGGPAASRWIPAIFGTLVFAYGGWVFISGAIAEIRNRLPGMMRLISLAISVAFVFSLAVTFGFPGSDLWWELATLVTIMVLGHSGLSCATAADSRRRAM
jgi:P-type Cu2+ transporter